MRLLGPHRAEAGPLGRDSKLPGAGPWPPSGDGLVCGQRQTEALYLALGKGLGGGDNDVNLGRGTKVQEGLWGWFSTP